MDGTRREGKVFRIQWHSSLVTQTVHGPVQAAGTKYDSNLFLTVLETGEVKMKALTAQLSSEGPLSSVFVWWKGQGYCFRNC